MINHGRGIRDSKLEPFSLTEGRKTQSRCSLRHLEHGGSLGALTSPRSHLALRRRQCIWKYIRNEQDDQCTKKDQRSLQQDLHNEEDTNASSITPLRRRLFLFFIMVLLHPRESIAVMIPSIGCRCRPGTLRWRESTLWEYKAGRGGDGCKGWDGDGIRRGHTVTDFPKGRECRGKSEWSPHGKRRNQKIPSLRMQRKR